MIKNQLKNFTFVAVSIILWGCASGPSQQKSREAQKPLSQSVRPGMNKDQVLNIAGKPKSRYSGLTGSADEMWIYDDGALNLIPIYGLVRGGRTNSVTIFFSKGKVSKVGESSAGAW